MSLSNEIGISGGRANTRASYGEALTVFRSSPGKRMRRWLERDECLDDIRERGRSKEKDVRENYFGFQLVSGSECNKLVVGCAEGF